MARTFAWLLGLALSSAVAADSEDEQKDLYFGEALFYANQAEYFDALQRLDTELAQHYAVDEPELDSLHFYINDAEFSVGDFELSYRMHHRAGRAITAVLEGDVDEEVRNEAAYRLARIHFQKGQLDDALLALERIEGRIPESIRDEVEFLRASVYLSTEEPAQAADILRRLQGADALTGFTDYNYGIALLQSGERDDALEQLDRAGQIATDDPAAAAIRDKANLVLGAMLLDSSQFDDAVVYLDRVRLDGPLSNQALLRAGWASASNEDYERALVPWNILASRNVTDAAVQEAILALPYAYGELDLHGRAAALYGTALDTFGAEIQKLDASITSIREGRFLKALVREEIRQSTDWVILLRSLPETPETYYLMQLLATHDFQTGLQNYLDLEDMRARLATWQRNFDAYDEMIGIRRAYYEPILPEIDQRFRELDSRIRLRKEQHSALSKRLQAMLTAPRPEHLATSEEQQMAAQLERLEADLGGADALLAERIDRLQGVLTWRLKTEYHDRLSQFYTHLQELGEAIDVMTEEYEAYVRVRQAAVHSFEGYDVSMRQLRTRVGQALTNVGILMARQGHALELVAINELMARRDRLDDYRNQARYALADSYDRATEMQITQVQE